MNECEKKFIYFVKENSWNKLNIRKLKEDISKFKESVKQELQKKTTRENLILCLIGKWDETFVAKYFITDSTWTTRKLEELLECYYSELWGSTKL